MSHNDQFTHASLDFTLTTSMYIFLLNIFILIFLLDFISNLFISPIVLIYFFIFIFLSFSSLIVFLILIFFLYLYLYHNIRLAAEEYSDLMSASNGAFSYPELCIDDSQEDEDEWIATLCASKTFSLPENSK